MVGAALALRESVKINIKVLKSVFTFFRATDIDSKTLSEFERSMFFAEKILTEFSRNVCIFFLQIEN